KMVSKRIESAQKSVEGRNFESRKHLLEYDDVMNKQRETIYGLRRQLMEEPDQRAYLFGDPPQNAGDPSAGVAYDLLSDLTKQYLNPNVSADDWDLDNYAIQIKTIYDLDVAGEAIDFEKLTSEEVTDVIWEKVKVKYDAKEKEIGEE